ncbi:MFS transporter [Micromonospora sp. BRA006-A]|nr:MFS transporter [Micromonospora sp. BRA006-A]
MGRGARRPRGARLVRRPRAAQRPPVARRPAVPGAPVRRAGGLVGLVFFAAMGVMFFGAFYLQLVRGYSPLESGLLFLPFAAAQLIFAPRSAAMVRRYGGRAVAAAGLLLTTVALAAFVFIDADTPIWIFSALGFLQGAGMANIMPPATESIMSSLPREKAGVGSAVSNTVRQVAGALGVAVLGSVLSAVYRDQVGPAVAALPAPVRDAARESVSGAYAVAGRLGPDGPRLIDAANDSFVSAMHWAAGASAVVAALGIVIVLRWMPGRPVVAPTRRRSRTGSWPVPHRFVDNV